MASNQSENAAARVKAEKLRRRVESRFSSGPGATAANAMGAAPFGSRPAAERRMRRDNEFDPVELRRAAPEGAQRPRAGDVGGAIGRELRNLFDDIVAQPVPDRFLVLLDRLEKDMLSSEAPPTAPGESE